MRRNLIRAAAFTMIGVSLLGFVWVAWALLYGDPITGYIAHQRQDSLKRDWQKFIHVRHTSSCPAEAASYRPGLGKPYALITIPRLGLKKTVVVEGTDNVSGELESGPGHYPHTSNPCDGKTVAIAGHRTTWGAWFRHIDDLRAGDNIWLTMPYGRYRYVVQRHQIVSPDATWIERPVGYDQLVLSACNPVYSAAQRWVVFAKRAT